MEKFLKLLDKRGEKLILNKKYIIVIETIDTTYGESNGVNQYVVELTNGRKYVIYGNIDDITL